MIIYDDDGIGHNVVPMRVIEGIKADLLRYEADCQLSADSQTCMRCSADTFRSIERIIDKHIGGWEG